MHITILSLGSRGDVQPYANLGAGLQAAGHRVRLVTFENFAAMAGEYGLDFHPIRGDAQTLVAGAGANMPALLRSFGALARSYARDLSDPRLGETDLILNQLPAGLYGYDLAEKYHVPLALASVIPLARTRAFPLVSFPNLRLPGYNRATYRVGEQIAWQMFRGTINRWRTGTLHLPALPLSGYFTQLGTERVPILNGFSPIVVPPPADWSRHIYTTGAWFPPDQDWQPPADLQRFIEAGSPPVFIGFGSMPVKNPQRTTAILLDALGQCGLRAILHAGWAGIGSQPVPETVFKIDSAPYGWLFPRMAMILHHGGSGTTAFGLCSGVASGVVSFLFDQHFWGERIASLGAGPRPVPFRKLSVEAVRNMVNQGVCDSAMRQRAANLGKILAAEDGVGNAVRAIEQILAHASKPGSKPQGP
jgi:UDP:flavonoid glycosyltransferase YjiC (YdhE family)